MVRRKGEALSAPPGGIRREAERFRLSFPHGFIDDGGTHRFWHADQAVLDDEELELLRARGVDLKEG